MTPEGEKALAVVLDQKNKRIADLEAERDRYKKALLHRDNRGEEYASVLARAEKAEAEVERLRAWVCPFDMTLCSIHIHERGGRKSLSPGKASGKTTGASPSGVSPSPPLCMRCPHDQTYHPSFDRFRCAHVDCTCPGFVAAAEPAAHFHRYAFVCDAESCDLPGREELSARKEESDYYPEPEEQAFRLGYLPGEKPIRPERRKEG